MKNSTSLALILFSLLSFYSCSFLDSNKNYTRALAQASNEIKAKYGPEFSFTNQKILASMSTVNDYNNPVNHEVLAKWREIFVELCEPDKCIVTNSSDKHGKAYKVLFPDGWWFQAGSDTGCLEVQTKPLTLEGFLAKKEILEKFIFDSGKKLNLIPHERIGGGHLNIDLATAFPNNNARLFRNFIVDQANHPELIWGIFGNHLGNSPPISALEPHLHDAFKSVIEEFDANGVLNSEAAIRDLGAEVERRVYVSNPFWLANEKKIWSPSYYQHLSFRSTKVHTPVEQRRLELRGFRPQQSVKEFLLEMEFFDARLSYLNNLEQDLEVSIPRKYEMPITEKKQKFVKILEETGLNREKFEHFLTSKIAYSDRVFPVPSQPTYSPPSKKKNTCAAAVQSFN